MATNGGNTCDITKPALDISFKPASDSPEGSIQLTGEGCTASSAPIVNTADVGGDINCDWDVRGVEARGGLATVTVSVRRRFDTNAETLQPSLLTDFSAEDAPSAGVFHLAGDDHTRGTPAAVGGAAPKQINGNASEHTSNGASHPHYSTGSVNSVSPPAEHVLPNLTETSFTAPAVPDISGDLTADVTHDDVTYDDVTHDDVTHDDVTHDDELDAVHPRLNRPSSASRLPVSRLDPRFICGTCRHDSLQWTDCVDHAYRLRHGLAERCRLCRLPAVTCRRRGQIATLHRCHVVDVVRKIGAKAIGALVDGSHLTVMRPWEIRCGQCAQEFGASTAKLVQHCVERAHAVRRYCERCSFPVMGYTLNGGCRELHVCVGGKEWLTAEECELLEGASESGECDRTVDVNQVIQVCGDGCESERAVSDQNVQVQRNGSSETDGGWSVPDSNNCSSSCPGSNGQYAASNKGGKKSFKDHMPSIISGNAPHNDTPSLRGSRSGSKRNLSSDETSPSDRTRFCPTSEDLLTTSLQTNYLKVESGDGGMGANGSPVLPMT